MCTSHPSQMPPFLVGVPFSRGERRSLSPTLFAVTHTPDAHKGHHYISTSLPPPPLSVSPGGDGGGWARPNVVMPLVGIRRKVSFKKCRGERREGRVFSQRLSCLNLLSFIMFSLPIHHR